MQVRVFRNQYAFDADELNPKFQVFMTELLLALDAWSFAYLEGSMTRLAKERGRSPARPQAIVAVSQASDRIQIPPDLSENRIPPALDGQIIRQSPTLRDCAVGRHRFPRQAQCGTQEAATATRRRVVSLAPAQPEGQALPRIPPHAMRPCGP